MDNRAVRLGKLLERALLLKGQWMLGVIACIASEELGFKLPSDIYPILHTFVRDPLSNPNGLGWHSFICSMLRGELEDLWQINKKYLTYYWIMYGRLDRLFCEAHQELVAKRNNCPQWRFLRLTLVHFHVLFTLIMDPRELTATEATELSTAVSKGEVYMDPRVKFPLLFKAKMCKVLRLRGIKCRPSDNFM